MNFFERQDRARGHTRKLIVYFALALLFTIIACYVAITFILSVTMARPAQELLWNPEILLWVSVVLCGIALLGSGLKSLELSAGGIRVAESLGGRRIPTQTQEFKERQLLNIVEEMSIASGVAMPQVFILPDPGINAFAAGRGPADAAISVTQGALTHLDREELQGVIGHEFSHLLNGDMRLNFRLIIYLFGIQALALIGQILLRAAWTRPYYYRSSRDRQDNSAAAVGMIGIALVVIGGIGLFFGRLIKAAVSRERERLADASSVQFTRNPRGLEGALKKIGGLRLAQAPELTSEYEEVSHMLFSSRLFGGMTDLFATHPPLEERIRALDPSFNGKFEPLSASAVTGAPGRAAAPARPLGGQSFPPVFGPPAPAGSAPGRAAARIIPVAQAAAILSAPLSPDSTRIERARSFRETLPEAVLAAARDPYEAQAVVFAVLLDRDESIRSKQLSELDRTQAWGVMALLRKILPFALSLDPEYYLPVIDLALPALKQLSRPQFERLIAAVDALAKADEQVTLFEFVLSHVLRAQLNRAFGNRPEGPVAQPILAALLPQVAILFAALAYADQATAEEAKRAFTAGMKHLGKEPPELPAKPSLTELDSALLALSRTRFVLRQRIVAACMACVSVDERIRTEEAELLRAVAETFDCPLPPILGSEKMS